MQVQCEGKVGHLFFYVKQMFGYNKTRYRGLAKNENQLALLVDLPICCVPSLVGYESDGIGVSDKHQSKKHPTI